MRNLLPILLVFLLALTGACGTDAPPTGSAIRGRDSLPVMTTYGVSKLISDSGVVKYKLVAEEWRYYDRTQPARQEFPKGIFMERYDKAFKVDMYLTADTAYCYDNYLWELRGRVFVCERTKGITYSSEQLYWDTRNHRLYSHTYMHIVTPDRDLQGDWFEANDQLSDYHVKQTRGYMPLPQDKSATLPEPGAPGSPDSPDAPSSPSTTVESTDSIR